MFDLFRFMILRPPEVQDSERTIRLTGGTDFDAQLRAARAGDDPRAAMVQIADSFVQGADFVREVAPLTNAAALSAFSAGLAGLGNGGLAALEQAVAAAFGQPSSAVVAGAEFQADRRRLQDSLVAAKISLQADSDVLSAFVRDIRLVALIERVAAGDANLDAAGALSDALNRTVVLPTGLFPLPPGQRPRAGDGGAGGDDHAAVVQRYEDLQTAYRLLTQLEPEDLTYSLATVDPGVEEPEPEFTETERNLRMQAARLVFREADTLGGNERLDLTTKLTSLRSLQAFVADERLGNADGAVSPLRGSERLQAARLSVRPGAAERFSADVRQALADINVALEATDLVQAVERVKTELTQLTPKVVTALQNRATQFNAGRKMCLIGNQVFPMWVGGGQALAEPEAGPEPVLPTTHGSVKPVGVGDLLVVRQQLTGYELGEVAYIENVLKGESHKREVRRSETFEETVLTEQESTRTEERDLQTTERFELQEESANVLTQDGRLTEGFSSPKYGPVVQFENSDQNPLRGSQQISERRATTYGKDVTSRAASRVTERVRSQVTRRTVRQFEERTEHVMDNSRPDAGHVVGVYQWVNKVYQAQVFNYGRRLFYDLVVPEPAAFLMQAFARSQAEGRNLTKPDPFTVPLKDGTQRPLQPDDITDTNYAFYVGRYLATGVKAPPDAYITVSKILVGSTEPPPQNLELIIPDGYEPATRMRSALYSWKGAYLGSFTPSLDITLSKGRYWRAELGCRRKASYYQQWQLNTYEAILRAFRQQMGDYEERLANLQAALRVGALGLPADQKAALQRNELKKACITLFTYQHFDVFDGIDAPPDQPVRYPQINLATAEPQGRYIRFFEQAFEWDQMMYHYYPYFWGRKERWVTTATMNDPDPQFAEFLRAGSARTLVPVRPGFEQAIVHFMDTGEIWDGGEMPGINGPAYLPLLDEIKASANAPADGVPYGDPWQVRLPTSLVMLRSEAGLPRWRQEDGRWVPEP